GRERGHRAGPVYPQRREREQVGLDARAAARVGPGDRERHGRRVGVHGGERSGASSPSIARITAAGWSAPITAPITATPAAPASTQPRARPGPIPPSASTGRPSAVWTPDASPPRPSGGPRSGE